MATRGASPSRYLGDGVYARTEPGYLVLETQDGMRVTNTIFLDSEVLRALQQYLADLEPHAHEPDDHADDNEGQISEPDDGPEG
jgi:hypothetical protein